MHRRRFLCDVLQIAVQILIEHAQPDMEMVRLKLSMHPVSPFVQYMSRPGDSLSKVVIYSTRDKLGCMLDDLTIMGRSRFSEHMLAASRPTWFFDPSA